MPERVAITVDGRRVEVDAGVPLAVALANAGVVALRRSPSGEPRGALCAMGVCYECRVTIDGVAHRRSCVEPCVAGMEVRTDA